MWSYRTVDKWVVTWQKVQLVDSPTAKRYLEHFQLVYDFSKETFTINLRKVLAKEWSFIGWRDNGTLQRYPLTEDFTEFVDTAFLVDGEVEVAPAVVEPEPTTPPGQFPTAVPERPIVPDVTREWEPALDDKYEYRIQRRLK